MIRFRALVLLEWQHSTMALHRFASAIAMSFILWETVVVKRITMSGDPNRRVMSPLDFTYTFALHPYFLQVSI